MRKSQDNKEIKVFDNSFRLPKFQTRTVIAEENGKKIVYKYASNSEALHFLELIVEREQKNVVYFKEHFNVFCGTLNNDRIEYEYVPHQSLLDVIAEYLRQNDYAAANKIFQRYVEKLYLLQQVRMVPEEFLALVERNKCCCKPKVTCLRRGVFDLTPRNILIGDNGWIVLDNEWSFDFPVPVVFVLFRALREMAIELQNDIRRNTSKAVPVTNRLAFGLHNLYMPVEWLNYLDNERVSLSLLLRWELGFKRYVIGKKPFGVGRVKRFPKERTSFPNWSQRTNNRLISIMKTVFKNTPRLRRLLRHFERKLLDYDN